MTGLPSVIQSGGVLKGESLRLAEARLVFFVFSAFTNAVAFATLRKQKSLSQLMLQQAFAFCRDDWIRTSDLYVPNVAHYRAVLHPAKSAVKIENSPYKSRLS